MAANNMDNTEYWLLDVVVKWQEPIASLMPASSSSLSVEDYFAITFNRKGHGLSEVELVDILYALFQKDYLIARWYKRHPCKPIGKSFSPSRHEIEAALSDHVPNRRLWYGLSTQGGIAWEAASHPDWNKYVYRYEEPDGKDNNTDGSRTVTIASASRSRVKHYLTLDQETYKLAVPGSARWEVFTPWQATYWKSLPEGYQVRHRIYDDEEWKQKMPAQIVERVRLGGDQERLTPKWYTNRISGYKVR